MLLTCWPWGRLERCQAMSVLGLLGIVGPAAETPGQDDTGTGDVRHTTPDEAAAAV